jgi:transposase
MKRAIDLHVKTMDVCILDAAGQVLVHRNVKSTPEAFLEIGAPYRDDLVVSAECMFTWYWLADVCAAEGIRFVLGHALAMKAIHGGKSKNDKIDSPKIASLLRGGLLPQSYVYPAATRSTRDLLRRRLHLVRKRGQLLAHIQNTRAQCNLPDFERRLAYRRRLRRASDAGGVGCSALLAAHADVQGQCQGDCRSIMFGIDATAPIRIGNGEQCPRKKIGVHDCATRDHHYQQVER